MSAEEEAAVIRVTTRFASFDDLVARSVLLVMGDAITVAAAPLPAIGERRRFQVVLADGTVALDGLGEVIAGKRLKIIELDAPSKALHERILAARKPLPRPAKVRTMPPPFRKTLDGPPSPAVKLEDTPPPVEVPVAAPVVSQPTPARVQAPAPASAPAPEMIVTASEVAMAPPTAPVVPRPPPEETMLVTAAWQPPPWLVTRKAKITMATIGAILLIGIVAAMAGGGDAKPTTPAPFAGAASIDAGISPPTLTDPDPDAAPSEPEPAVEDVDAGAEVEPEPEPEPPRKQPAKPRPKKPAPTKPPPAEKRASGKQVRVSVRSDPKGATIKIDGANVSGGSAMLASGSVVTVTATMRGYKRARKTWKISKGTSIVIKLDRM